MSHGIVTEKCGLDRQSVYEYFQRYRRFLEKEKRPDRI